MYWLDHKEVSAITKAMKAASDAYDESLKGSGYDPAFFSLNLTAILCDVDMHPAAKLVYENIEMERKND